MLPDADQALLTQVKRGAEPPKRVTSESLLGGGREVVIVHGGREYRLRQTQSGKLILTA
jgi:hemin uptake protein HemP